ncbi:MAG: 3-dehydroquinate synthase [Planctomycetota bacterium]|jgi:3-dehydroquinate synthase
MDKTIGVHLGTRSYDVRVGAGELGELGRTVDSLGGVSSAVVITDTTVRELHGERALHLLKTAGLKTGALTFPAGETHKTLATYNHLMDQLFALATPVDRHSVIVAVGGGVVGDVAGFVAATALRGMRWVQCPTTLLADVDASVGGKTAVDHPTGKNLIGAFHQPSAVVIDVETLKTLPKAELGNGLAECVKHGVIRDAALLEFIEDSAADILACDGEVMTELVARNVAIKAAVVSADEREAGERAHLNFGHTIGHAIEVLAGYDRMPHGQAVSLGMVAACRMAVDRKLIGVADAQAVASLLEQLGLPVSWADLDAAEVWKVMQVDKKARAGQVRMILPTRLGAVDAYDDITEDDVRSALEAVQP